MTIQIIQMLISKSNSFTRPGKKMTPTSITDHETDNNNVRANARAHALLQYNGNGRQASWHFQVDDEPEVYQSIPINENSYHAGDSTGNNTSISVERCVNKDGDYLKTLANTIELYRWLLKTVPSIKHIYQHNKWSGKHCPRKMREGYKGINWDEFIRRVRSEPELAKPIKPVVDSEYITTNVNFNIGDKVRIKKTAKTYATGQTIPSSIKGKTDTIQQRGSNRMLLKGIYSWVKTSDLELIEKTASKPASKPAAKPKPTTNKVTLKKTAKNYATGQRIPASIKNKQYTVIQRRKNEVLLEEIMSWVFEKDVTGLTASTSKPKPQTFKVGSKVKVKSSASKYSRANVTIPARFKGKSYTIQQVSKSDVLIKELYSWVKKRDLI